MWQPIETAPKDQTFLAVLNCAGQQTICTMRWAVAEEKNSRPDHYAFHVERVTHWMALPDLPGAPPAPSVPDDVMRDAERYRYLRARDVANESDTYEQAKAKLDNLIGFHVDVATDPAVNGGWRLIPIRPTPEMRNAWDSSPICEDDDAEFRRAYSEMLAAAPEVKP